MRRMTRWAIGLGLAVVFFWVPVGAQGTLSQQVLQMLQRTNAWIGTNTFSDLRMANTAIPSTTTYRIYADTSGNLYFNGGLIAGAGGGVTPHNLFSTTHPDTVVGSPVRGDVIIANSTPAWTKLARCTSGNYIGSNGTDTVCATSAAAFTAIPGGQITGTIAAVSGVNLTNLNASNLASGTVPLAQLANIGNAQISAAAAIAYSKLNIANGVTNNDINNAAGITYAKLSLTGSIVTGDLVSATLLFNRWAQNGAVANQVPLWNGAAWVATTLTPAMLTGGGTVTSVALSAPAIFSVAGSPITTAGTLAVTLATQTANLVWAGPTGGGAAQPTFRALVNADFPTSGVVAGTYPVVTVNAQGLITAGSASFASGTIVASAPWTFTQTWNNAGVTFNGILENITDTASNAASLLMDLQVAAASKWKVTKAGNVTAAGTGTYAGLLTASAGVSSTTGVFSSTVSMTALTATTGAFSGLLSANLGLTVPTAQTAVVTDTDALTVGGIKIPNTFTFTCTQLDANSVSGDCEFIADRAYQVTGIKFVQKTAGGAGCAADIEKLTGTTAPGSGTVMGTAVYDCNATANNTVTTYTLTGVGATLQLASGNRMGIKLGGTLTALAGLTATVTMKAI